VKRAPASDRPRAGSGMKMEDELDEKLIASLQEDGRLSNMALSRKYDVSEALIRQRLKKLYDAKRIQAVVVADLRSLGYMATSLVSIAVSPKAVDSVAQLVCDLPQVAAVFVTTGPYQIASWWNSRDAGELNQMVDESLRSHPSVRSVSVRSVVSAQRFDDLAGFIVS
jgi:DNA-binding Lrp family transcriptional regulator